MVVSVLAGAAVLVLLPLGRIRLARLLAVVALSQAFNKDLASVYRKFATPVASVYGAFRTADLTDKVTTPAFGTVPLDVAMVCSYTWECAPPPVGAQ